MEHPIRPVALPGPGSMFLSAVIFGFFGFFLPLSGTITYNYTNVGGQFLLYVALFEWTMQIASITFLLCGVLTMFHRLSGNVIYAITGLLTALVFVLIAILDFMDTTTTIFAFAPWILLAFAAWNGYAASESLVDVKRVLSARSP